MAGTSNHILYVISVSGTIDVGVMAFFGFIFDVSTVNRDTSGFFLGGFVNGSIVLEVGESASRLTFGNSSR